jgi:hypothetical protein
MSTRDHGGFDVMMEVSPTLASQIFSSGAVVQAPYAEARGFRSGIERYSRF